MICYLDMDGVLVDFIGGVCKIFNITKEQLNASYAPGEWVFHKVFQMTESDLWQEIDRHGKEFWSDLHWMDDGKDILTLCEKYFENIVLMTSPSLNPHCAAGKVEWLQKNLPAYSRHFAITPKKHYFAHPNAALVDDNDKNIEDFWNAGGNAIQVPRRWNREHSVSHQAIETLEQRIQCYCGKGKTE